MGAAAELMEAHVDVKSMWIPLLVDSRPVNTRASMLGLLLWRRDAPIAVAFKVVVDGAHEHFFAQGNSRIATLDFRASHHPANGLTGPSTRRIRTMTIQHGTPHPPGSGVRPTDKDPQPSEDQDENDLGEDEGEDKGGGDAAETLDPSGQQATPGIDVGIEK